MNLLQNGLRYFTDTVSSPAASQYHGLLNQGATCYLNSVLQVLHMTEDFREAVKRHTCETCVTECIDPHLASLFDDLKEFPAYTYNITKKLGIKNVYEQRDAAEYFEKILGLTSHEASQIFHGLLTHRTKCSTCGAKTEADRIFWHLPLALEDSNSGDYSVVNGIKEYFSTSDFKGENQMYCDNCDAKSDATIRCVIKRHPEVLMVLLKRFEFDDRYMTNVKINRTVDIPYSLQIPTNQTYELYAVVEHFGDLRSGHYSATIKTQEEQRWYNFNDGTVTLLDYQPFQLDNLEKSSSAYLLFYRKKTVHAPDTCSQDIREVSTHGGFPPATIDISYQCQDVIKRREREEVEGSVEVGNEPAVIVSTDKNDETGIRDIISVGFRGGGLSSDLCNVVEDRDNGVYARHLEDVLAENQRDKGEIMMDDEEDMRGNAEKSETLSRETLEESEGDQDNDRCNAIPDNVRQKRPQEGLEGGDMHNTSYNTQMYKQEVSNMHPQQVCVDMQKDEERMDVNRDEDGDEQPERRGREKYLHRDAEHQDNEGLGDVRQKICEDLRGKQEVGQDYDLKHVRVDKQGDGEMMGKDDKFNKDRKSGRGKILTIPDLCCDDIQSNGGDSKESMPKDDQRCKGESTNKFYRKLEEPRDAKEEKQQKRGHDKHAQRKGTSERQQQDQKRRLGDVRQNICEDLGGKQEVGQDYDLKPVRVDKLCVDMQKNEERMDVNRDEEGNEQPERRGREKYLHRDAERQDNEGLGDVRQNLCEDLRGKQEVGQDYDLKPVRVDKQGDGEMMAKDDKFNKDRKSGRGKILTIPDLCCDDIQSNGGDSKESMPKDDQRCKGESTNKFYRKLEEPRDAKEEKQQKRGHDKHAQRKGTSERQQQDQKRRLGDVRQNICEDLGGKQEVGQDYDLKPVRVDKQGDGEMMGIDDKFNKDRKSGRGKILTIPDLCCDDIQSNGGDRKESMPKDDQRCKGESTNKFYRRLEEPRDAKEQKQQKRGDNKHAQRKGTSERQQDQKRRSGDVRQNICEDLGGKQEVGQDYDLKPVRVDKQGDGEMMGIDDKFNKDRKSGRGKILTIPDLCCDDIRSNGGDSKESMPKDDQSCKGESTNKFYRKLEEPRDAKEEKQQKRGDDKHAQRKGTSERQQQDQKRRSGDVRQNICEDLGGKQEVGQDYDLKPVRVDKLCVDMQKDEERMDVNRDEDGNEQPERRGREKYLHRDAERQDNEGLGDVRQNICEDLRGKQEVGQDYDLKPVRVDKQGDGEMMEIDHNIRDRKSGSGRLLIKYDLYCDDIRSNGGDRKESMPKDDQRCKRSSRFDHRHEEPRDVKEEKQQKRGDDKHAQRKGTSERQQDHNRRLDDVRQNRSERVSTHKDAAKQGKEQEKKGDDEHIRRADSSFRRGGLAGSSGVTENRGSVERSQPEATNEVTMEGRSGSKQSKTLHVTIVEEETHGFVQRSSVRKNISIESVAGTSQGGIKSWAYNEGGVIRKSDPKTDAKVTLSEDVGNLKLSDSPSPKPQKHRTEVISDAQIQAVGMKHAKKIRGEKNRHFGHHSSPLKQNTTEKKKHNKTTGFFSFFWKSRENADYTSESD